MGYLWIFTISTGAGFFPSAVSLSMSEKAQRGSHEEVGGQRSCETSWRSVRRKQGYWRSTFGEKLKLGPQKVAVWKGNPRLFQEDVFPIENGDIPLPC